MGYERFHTIVVTGSYGSYLEEAHAKALELFHTPWRGLPDERIAEVSAITPEAMNCRQSSFIAPDGSKEGWDLSDAGDKARAQFIEFLETMRYDDLSHPLSWVEVQYGDDERETRIVNDNDAIRREEG